MKKILTGLLTLALFVALFAGCNVSVDMGWGAAYHYSDADSYTMGGTELSDDIRKLDIRWISGGVTVQYHEGDHILISETSDKELTEKTSLYYRVAGNTLTIQYAKSGVWTTIDFDKDLTVSLPKRFSEDGTTPLSYSLSFETVSADVEIAPIDVSACEFENVSGNIKANLLGNTSSLSIETVSGNVNVSAETLTSFDAESVSGNISLSGGDIQSGDAETVSGDFSLALPYVTGYTLDFESVSGVVDILGASYEAKGDRYIVGDGTARYDIETVSGNVHISSYKQ